MPFGFAVGGHVRRIAGFALIPGISLATTVVLLPIVSHRFGDAGWTSVALGQSIGSIVAVIASLGWPTVGGQLVASSGASETARIYAESLRSRAAVLLAALPFAIAIVAIAARAERPTAILFTVSVSLNGLSSSWFYAGLGRPRLLVRNEASVRLAGYVASIAVLIGRGPLWSYGAITLVAAGVMLWLNVRFGLGTWSVTAVSQGEPTMRILVRHKRGVVGRLAASCFQYAGPLAFSLLHPAGQALYSAIYQLQNAASNGLGALPQGLIAWVGGADADAKRRRAVRASWVSTSAGLAVFFAWGAGGRVLADLLYSGRVHIGVGLNWLVAAAIAVNFVSLCLSFLLLVPLGRSGFVFAAMGLVSVAATVVLCVAARFAGVTGGVFASFFYGAVLLIAFVWRSRNTRLPGIPRNAVTQTNGDV